MARSTPTVGQLLDRLAQQMHRMALGKTPNQRGRIIDSLMHRVLIDKPNSLLAVLEYFVAALRQPDDELLPERIDAACLAMSYQLEQLRFNIERGYPWATDIVDSFQDAVATLATRTVLPFDLLGRLCDLLRTAKLPLKPRLQTAFDNQVGHILERRSSQPVAIDQILSEQHTIIDSLREASPGTVIELVCGLGTSVGPTATVGLFNMLFEQEHAPELRQIVPLGLLDSNPGIRQAVAALLASRPEYIDPVSLRRMILVRSWLPKEERGALDAAIRSARLRDGVPANWKALPTTPQVIACSIDGAGAMSFFIVVKQKDHMCLASILTRLDRGLHDLWMVDHADNDHIVDLLVAASEQGLMMVDVKQDLLNMAMRSHLATMQKQGTVPSPLLLLIAEWFGAIDWQPQVLDIAQEAGRLLGRRHSTDPARLMDPADIARDSALVIDSRLTESWFLDGQAVDALLTECKGQRSERVSQRLLREMFEPERACWAERFLWNALWLHNIYERHNRPSKAILVGFARMALRLHNGCDLASLPVLVDMARQSVAIGRERRQKG